MLYRQFSKNLKNEMFKDLRSRCFVWTDRRTEVSLIFAVRSWFAKAPKDVSVFSFLSLHTLLLYFFSSILERS